MYNDRSWTIYGLIDPRVPRAIRYIGLTVNIRQRERDHHFKASGHESGHNRAFVEWKEGLRLAGIDLLAISLETHRSLESAQEAEGKL